MGPKFRILVIGLVIICMKAAGQANLDFQAVDSLTYKYYLSGEWEKLILTGKNGIDKNIDYKFLRQRIAYAYYAKSDYIRAIDNFEKALRFDSSDTFTLTWLYYSYILAGEQSSARFLAGIMPDLLRKKLSVRLIQPVESIELEYNFKYSTSGLRANPQYYHVGINSVLGSKLEIYQMFAVYSQKLTFIETNRYREVSGQQPEYYALLKYNVSSHISVKAAYHYLHSTYDSLSGTSNMGFLEISARKGWFHFAVNGSVFKDRLYTVSQSGLKARMSLNGDRNVYFGSALSLTSRPGVRNLIYDQTAGMRLIKNLWVQGSVTLGDLTYYHDHDAMYVYNLFDPVIFRSGAAFFLYSGAHLTVWTNFSYEKKEYYETSLFHYNQFSYLGGIKWKL